RPQRPPDPPRQRPDADQRTDGVSTDLTTKTQRPHKVHRDAWKVEVMNSPFSSLWALCLLCVFVVKSSAAAPTITYLYPEGAQRGTAVEVTAAGTFDASAKVWASGKGVSIEATKTAGKLKVTVAKDAVPGTYWLRAYNDDGASTLRPFIVGTLPE